MGDEISYLKAELKDVIGKIQDTLPNLDIQLGSVFYRDQGDAYITKTSDLSSDISKTVNFIKNQSADGGGDEPEAVEEALEEAIKNLNWRENVTARLLFLVLDAPPHHNDEIVKKMQELTALAAEKGIRIIPVTCSGIGKSTEYLMRSLALATNGTYLFLTDHSGVGNPHIEPTTDEYDVELLNDLLIRVIYQFSYSITCNQDLTLLNENKEDTIVVNNPEFKSIQQQDSLTQSDITTDTNEIVAHENPDSEENSIDNENSIKSWKYYPNPVSNILTVEVEGKSGYIYITDMSGKIV